MLRRKEILSAALIIVTLCPMLLADKKADRKKRRAEKRAAKAANAGSKTESESASYLRLLRDDQDEPVALQTSIVRFSEGKKKSDTGPVIDLIGAVHIGDRNYYKKLNTLFESYDVLLFELVAPEGTVPTPMARANSGGNPISMMQSMTKDMLNLDSQLELVDYTKKNFVHADMSPSEMAKRMEERGDTGITVALTAMAEIMRQANAQAENGVEEVNPLELLTSMRDPAKMKRLMAKQFVDTGALDTGLGATLNRMIVTDRNEACMKVLERERAKGHRRIGIFYGAAHMPDFEKRIAEKYGYKPQKPQWLTAWDLTAAANPRKKAEDPVEALLNLFGN